MNVRLSCSGESIERSPMREERQLIRAGFATAFCYFVVAAFYLLGGEAGRARWLCLTLGAPALIWFFQRGRGALDGDAPTNRLVVIFAAIFAIGAVLVPVTHFSDLPTYVGRGWEQYHY